MTKNEATNSTRRICNKPKDITNMVSNDVYGLILDYIKMYNIPIPKTFSLHPCGLYARKRLKHWSNNSNMSMHLDASNLKEVIYEWINSPYVEKDYISNYDIDAITHVEHIDYKEGEASIMAKEYGFIYNYSVSSYLKKYLKETLPMVKVNYNGVKGIILYDATNLEEIIFNWLNRNDDSKMLIMDCINKNNIPIPETFSLHICSMYVKKRVNHLNNSEKGYVSIDTKNLKEVIYEWINSPYVDKKYISNYDIEEISLCTPTLQSELKKYLKETLPKRGIPYYNGVKGIVFYDATNIDEIIHDWVTKNEKP